MNVSEVAQLKADFRRWSGGFSPESIDQITVYIDYALSVNLDPEIASRALLDWFGEDDPEYDSIQSGLIS